MDIGNRIYELRNNAGLTQELLAEKLHVSRQSVTKWEKNESAPEIERLIDLSMLFGVSIDYLLKGKNEYTTHTVTDAINLAELKSFLCTAKKNTYAAHGPEIVSSRMHSHDLQYEDGILSYLDSYFGGENFIGEEVMYIDSKPFWAMNYSGRVLDVNFSGDFLKECLLAVSIEMPFRGPELHQNGNYTYHCSVQGSFDWFFGEETIFFQSSKVYECIFHGGTIK